ARTLFYSLSLHDALPIFLVIRARKLRILMSGKNLCILNRGISYQVFAKHLSIPQMLRQSHKRSKFMIRKERYAGLIFKFPPCNRSEEHTSELQSRENLVC